MSESRTKLEDQEQQKGKNSKIIVNPHKEEKINKIWKGPDR